MYLPDDVAKKHIKKHGNGHIVYTSYLPVKSVCDIGQQQTVYSSFSEINANAPPSPSVV